MANEVRQIQLASATDTVPGILSTINSSFARAVVVVDSGVSGNKARSRTSGNVFLWQASGTANNGTIYAGSTGVWEMQYDVSYIDVKWFGAVGNWQEANPNNTDDRVSITNAINFAVANKLDLYISKGSFLITPPSSGSALTIDLVASGAERIRIWGAGSRESSLVYDTLPPQNSGTPTILPNINVLEIISNTNTIIDLEDFEIRGALFTSRFGTGLHLSQTYPLTVKNLHLRFLNKGMVGDSVNNANIQSCFIEYNSYGFVGDLTLVGGTLPNVLNFTSGVFLKADISAALIKSGHSVNFQSCDLSQNGTPATTNSGVSGIDFTFNGVNGANGLNVKDCYIEGNVGLADIQVTQLNGGTNNPLFATHTFQGNTFNRNLDLDGAGNFLFTENNILIIGSGQEPQQKFSDSKCRLIFTGNGFFVNQPGATNNYEPDASRRAINLQYATNALGLNLWEFDILEQGNAYPGLVDSPVYSNATGANRVFNDKTPQISEYTRVKAFGLFEFNREDGTFSLKNTYNIDRIERFEREPGTTRGSYKIYFANELQTIPIPVFSYFDVPEENVWGILGSFQQLESTYIIMNIFDFPSGEQVDNTFCLTVH